MENDECSICNKVMTDDEIETGWNWAEEPAHSECVIMESSDWCEECNWFDTEGEECAECGKPMKTLTIQQKAKLVKEHPNVKPKK